MLSEIVASLLALAFRPDTPAFSDEEIPMLDPLSVGGASGGDPWRPRLKIRLTPRRQRPYGSKCRSRVISMRRLRESCVSSATGLRSDLPVTRATRASATPAAER